MQFGDSVTRPGRILNSSATNMEENRYEVLRETVSSLSYINKSFESFYAELPVSEAFFKESATLAFIGARFCLICFIKKS